jgi:hypothetical protein
VTWVVAVEFELSFLQEANPKLKRATENKISFFIDICLVSMCHSKLFKREKV